MTQWYKAVWLKKMSTPMNPCSLSLSSTLGEVCLHMYFILWAKSKRFHRKVNNRCFRWLPGSILVDHMVSPYKLSKVAWNTSTNNSETMYRTDLRIGEGVKRFVSYSIPSFWPFSWNDCELIFFVAWQWNYHEKRNEWKTEHFANRSYRAS